ncbi:MAG: aminoacyl-tRNA hydrolase [Candidatus Coatesbacteria bacterium]
MSFKPESPLLIVGLGNPGSRYDGTRHNAGAMAVARLAELLETRFHRSFFKHAWIAKTPRAILARPNAFMNECGPVVARLAKSFGRPLVVHDDLDLPLGALRFRTKGSAGGHNGVASAISFLGTPDFPRLKIGIGRPASKDEVVDWVLTRCDGPDRAAFDGAIVRAADALRAAVDLGLDRAMTELAA